MDDVDKAGWTYVPEDNVESSDSIPAGQSNKMAAVSNGIKGIGPNPFNPQTTIAFSLERDERAVIGVYDLTGRLVMSLADRTYSAGDHSVVWHGKDAMGRAMPSGSYIVGLETESGVEARKVSLIR